MEKLLLDNVNVCILPHAEVPHDLDIHVVCYVITARSMGYNVIIYWLSSYRGLRSERNVNVYPPFLLLG